MTLHYIAVQAGLSVCLSVVQRQDTVVRHWTTLHTSTLCTLPIPACLHLDSLPVPVYLSRLHLNTPQRRVLR